MNRTLPSNHPLRVAFAAFDEANDNTVSWEDFAAGWFSAMEHVAQRRGAPNDDND